MLISPPVTAVPVIAPIPVAVSPPAKSNPGRQPGERQNEKNPGEGESAAAVKKSTEKQQSEAEDQAKIEELKKRDQEVRAHEAAHKGAAGQYARGAAQFTYERGPDGQQYAVGGEVSIDTSRPSDPQEALKKSATLMRAALAPAQPSAQDKQVAAEASQMGIEARNQIIADRLEKNEATSVSGSTEAISAAYEVPQQTPEKTIDLYA
jgi:hypothetical protein